MNYGEEDETTAWSWSRLVRWTACVLRRATRVGDWNSLLIPILSKHIWMVLLIGKKALEASQHEPRKWEIATLKVDADDADAVGNEPVLHNDKVIGVVTSGGYSHTYATSIALAYLKPEFLAAGTTVAITILGENRSAIVQESCLFDPTGMRLRS